MKKISIVVCLWLIAISSSYAGESKVILHLLDQTGKPAKVKKARFWIDWNDSWCAITETKELKGAEAKEIISLLKSSLSKTPSENFGGHSPVYGIVASTEEGTKLKTSLCFSCLTWTKPKRRMNILGKPGVENPLCVALRKHIELPESLRKPKSK